MTTANYTTKDALDSVRPVEAFDALRKLFLSYKETGIVVTVPAAPAIASRATPKATIVGSTIVLDPPAASVRSCRVTTGSAAAGTRIMSDAGATPAQIGTSGVYVATLSADGTTITFEAAPTAAVISYIPRITDADLAALFAPIT